jgi:hypothetical protein
LLLVSVGNGNNAEVTGTFNEVVNGISTVGNGKGSAMVVGSSDSSEVSSWGLGTAAANAARAPIMIATRIVISFRVDLYGKG